ncbi:GDP-mannose transporter GONST1 [Apostasia shenzhenica]|uniref:GDP-mannose transporter GONST1 n=1 Tax=Apostasia shenzhenica TaxID=1088818 RepID=A0A2I0AE26_9ASPA|nr:GDP-mannose transporter GONST1 [Apostasia shenzhenica]
MGSRALPLSVPADASDVVLERLSPGDSSDPLLDGRSSQVFSSEANGALGSVSSAIGGGKREFFFRSSYGSKFCYGDDTDLEDGDPSRKGDNILHFHRPVNIPNQALLSGFAYCLSSCSMILVNKYVLSGFNFNAGISLMLYQNFVSVAIVTTLSKLGIISTEPLTWRLIRVWLPVNVIFVGMLVTSIFSLKYINVAMVTVLKNIANVITAIGEIYLFKKRHGSKVWTALFLMIVSAVSGGATDLSFHAIGYSWQTLNCFFTASYSLTMRRVMDVAKQTTKSGNLNEFSMVLLNNLLSLPLGVLLIIAFSEVDYLLETPLLKMPVFWLVITLSGLLGLAISFTSMWFLHQTGATTYSLVGSLNKIPLSVAGILLFKAPTSMENLLSILFGLLAGVFFAKAKMKS